MSNTGTYQAEVIAKAHVPGAEVQGTEKEILAGKGSLDITKAHPPPMHESDSDDFEDKPTEEEMNTLRRVSGKIRWGIYTIAFAELCERFSYYGTSIMYTNFVQRPLPPGSTTGANPEPNGTPGALGMGQRASTGIGLTNMFFAYFMPLFGAYIADARLGRYWTIHIAIAVATIAHAILTAASAPSVIVRPDASFAAFIIGMLCLCVGTGFFKANISPMLAEQNQDTRMRVETLPTGERVIVDPAVTNTRIFLWFYFAINVGSLAGQLSMVFVEKHEGFWLAFLLPTVLFLICPLVLGLNKKTYILKPPTGSVFGKFLKVFFFSVKKVGWFKKVNFDVAKPSAVPEAERPAWMTYDDEWVDEIKRGLKACKVFLFLPIFHLAYNQMTGNLTSQAASMTLNGAPNDVIQNLNPISIVVLVPFFDAVLYPGLRKAGIPFTPIKRMTTGFFFGCSAMIAAAVMQHYIYSMSECGEYATECETVAPINVWAQCLPYVLIGISEIFTNVTSYEYAFSKAPENMKSLVMSVNLFMSAFAAAVGQAFTPLSEDPLLVWNYTAVAIIAFLGGVGFWFCFKHYDSQEDKLNTLKKTKYMGKVQPNAHTQDSIHPPVHPKEEV